MKFRVHIYAVVRVPVEIEAGSAREAALKAEKETDLFKSVKGAEYAEQITGFHVDELDENGEVNGDGVTLNPDI